MTVIAWDGETLAADKRADLNGLVRTVTKIARIDDYLCGFAGGFALSAARMLWLRNGADPARFPKGEGDDWSRLLVIRRDLTILVYEHHPVPMEFEPQQFAIGSGRDYAMAAMHLGRLAREAVRVACELDSSCGNGIDTLTFFGPT